MFQINCLNPISKVGLDRLTADYKVIDNMNDAEGVLVRSASMHELELPENLLAVARAGAGVNNICLLYTSPSPRDRQKARMPSSA